MMLSPLTLYAHSGRTDGRGGHNNNISGGYHYHSGRGSGDVSIWFWIICFFIGTPIGWYLWYCAYLILGNIYKCLISQKAISIYKRIGKLILYLFFVGVFYWLIMFVSELSGIASLIGCICILILGAFLFG